MAGRKIGFSYQSIANGEFGKGTHHHQGGDRQHDHSERVGRNEAGDHNRRQSIGPLYKESSEDEPCRSTENLPGKHQKALSNAKSAKLKQMHRPDRHAGILIDAEHRPLP